MLGSTIIVLLYQQRQQYKEANAVAAFFCAIKAVHISSNIIITMFLDCEKVLLVCKAYYYTTVGKMKKYAEV